MDLRDWKSKGKHHTHLGHPIFYLDEGEGEVLLLIHGFPTSSWDWWKLWPSLTSAFRVIALDMMGFGFSGKPKKYDYSILDQADIHTSLLNQLNVRIAHVLAHDYGDTVTQELLARQLEGSLSFKMESICLLNGGLFPETHKPRLIQKLLIGPFGRLVGKMMTRKKLGENFIQIFGPNSQPSEDELDQFWELIEFNDGKNVMHKLIRYMSERRQYRERWVGALVNSDVPIRLIDGEFDPISGLHMTRRYEELIENPDVVLLDTIGHYPQTEAPDLVLKHYSAFRDDIYKTS